MRECTRKWLTAQAVEKAMEERDRLVHAFISAPHPPLVRLGMLIFLSWLSRHACSCPTCCAQRIYPLRKSGPKVLCKLLQPMPLHHFPPYLGEHRLSLPPFCALGLSTRCESPEATAVVFSCRLQYTHTQHPAGSSNVAATVTRS
jgi:hypothetical protein